MVVHETQAGVQLLVGAVLTVLKDSLTVVVMLGLLLTIVFIRLVPWLSNKLEPGSEAWSKMVARKLFEKAQREVRAIREGKPDEDWGRDRTAGFGDGFDLG